MSMIFMIGNNAVPQRIPVSNWDDHQDITWWKIHATTAQQWQRNFDLNSTKSVFVYEKHSAITLVIMTKDKSQHSSRREVNFHWNRGRWHICFTGYTERRQSQKVCTDQKQAGDGERRLKTLCHPEWMPKRWKEAEKKKQHLTTSQWRAGCLDTNLYSTNTTGA